MILVGEIKKAYRKKVFIALCDIVSLSPYICAGQRSPPGRYLLRHLHLVFTEVLTCGVVH